MARFQPAGVLLSLHSLILLESSQVNRKTGQFPADSLFVSFPAGKQQPSSKNDKSSVPWSSRRFPGDDVEWIFFDDFTIYMLDPASRRLFTDDFVGYFSTLRIFAALCCTRASSAHTLYWTTTSASRRRGT